LEKKFHFDPDCVSLSKVYSLNVGHSVMLTGIELFNAEGGLVLALGNCTDYTLNHNMMMKKNQRIVGFFANKSKKSLKLRDFRFCVMDKPE
jgi:hypothetical protein